jgi:hypothetical protein
LDQASGLFSERHLKPRRQRMRIFSPYDYWPQTSDVLRLTRGERIWLSTDANIAAEISLTSAYAVARRPLFNRIERLRNYFADISRLRSR